MQNFFHLKYEKQNKQSPDLDVITFHNQWNGVT